MKGRGKPFSECPLPIALFCASCPEQLPSQWPCHWTEAGVVEDIPQLWLNGTEDAHTGLGLLSPSVVQGCLLVENWLQGAGRTQPGLGVGGEADLFQHASPELGKVCSTPAASLGMQRGWHHAATLASLSTQPPPAAEVTALQRCSLQVSTQSKFCWGKVGEINK